MAFLGMRGTGDWVTDERPKHYREGILRLYPNGDAPLTAIMSKMKTKPVTDPEYKWWTKGLPTQACDVTNVFTDQGLSTAYTTGGAIGQILYVNIAAADVPQFRAGHQILLRNSDNYQDDCNAKVMATAINGASSFLTVKLLQADPTTTGIADCDRALIIGTINAEGAYMPSAVSYAPTKFSNYTQIFRNSLSITGTARATKIRTYDQYLEQKRETLELHSIEMEKAALWGIATETIGENGKPERTSCGLIPFIVANGGVVKDFSLDTDVSGDTWLASGEDWLDSYLEQIFRYGSGDRLAFCGSQGILAINRLVKNNGTYQFTAKTMDYGIQVTEWVTPFGTIYLKRHPLFSYETTNRNSMVIFDPADLAWCPIEGRDTKFYGEKDQQNTGEGRKDATDEEYLTEGGFEFHHPQKCGWLNGIGVDNALS